ncbi:dCTP deaminase domain-containing protein [Micromonospora rubida]|uniref:dCTP deaminase domain-containing protein n=1 Tax=Micromonospora rubida TaxID=2697657 RepID=UPI001377F4B1|nr:hypothetical protein [Micromonospora rubida]NBE79610.1 hypothetical protein [Micromonospora rubida]
MHLCSRDDIGRLRKSGDLEVSTPGGTEPVFLDEHRLGMHIAELHRVEDDIDLTAPDAVRSRRLDPAGLRLEPDAFYLGVTRERFRLGGGLAASLHTRSRYARLGLELLGSSNFVVPGFGSTGAAPLVFEISVKKATQGFSSSTPYCFLLLYRLLSPRRTVNQSDYRRRFPMQHTAQAGDTT